MNPTHAATPPAVSPGASPAASSAGDGRSPVSLWRLLGLFLRIGAIGFGGGMAVIALMERELVDERRLMPSDEFLHGVGLSQVLGPFAVNAAFFVGYRRHGLFGGLASATAFLAPSVAAVIGLSAVYFHYHHVPALADALTGLGPMVIALILAAAWSMGRKAVTSWTGAMLAAAGLVAGILKANAVWVLLAAGAVGLLLGRRGGASPEEPLVPPAASASDGPGSGERIARLLPALAPAGIHSAGSAALLLTFAKVGLVFFGGGFVLVAILHQELVGTLQWLTPREFLDGVAISNLTPGPIAVLATFAGYKLRGVGGALVATIGLFIPAIVLMSVLSAMYTRLQGSWRLHAFMSGVGPAVVGLVAGAAVLLWPSGILSWRAFVVMVVALALLVRWRWHPAFVLAMGVATSVVGWIR